MTAEKPSWIVTSAKRTKKERTSGVAPGYLHGYSSQEQARLFKQARFLEDSVYQGVDFFEQSKILEVGSGVGAQTQILLERFPHLVIQGIDASPTQVTRARKALASEIRRGRVKFDQGDALHLPYRSGTFDGAFICWLLEHVQKPVEILKEVRRTLKPGSVIYCSEVLNATLYVHPYSPATLQYWFAFNDSQWGMKGDPFVGGKLANLLKSAGYASIETRPKVYHYDNRTPKRRKQFIQYWTDLLLSGAPALMAQKKVTRELVREMKQELKALQKSKDSVFFYTWIQARAEAR